MAGPTVLRSASELDYPPFALVRKDGSADGFSVDLLKAVARSVGLDVRFAIGPWTTIKGQLASGELDVLPLVSYSSKREKEYDFTAPYLRMQGTAFVRKGDGRIKSLSDLRGKEVLVMQGDTAHEFALQQKLTDRLITTASYEEAMRLLAAGKHDAVLVQQLVGLLLLKELRLDGIVPLEMPEVADLKLTPEPLQGFEQKFCFAVAEGNRELQARLNEGLAIVYADGTYESLYRKWFAPVLPPPDTSLEDILHVTAMIIVPLLLVMGLGGYLLLRRKIARKTAIILQSQERFKNFMDSATDGFLLYDDQLRLCEMNDQAIKLLPFRTEKGQLLGSMIGGTGEATALARAVRLVTETGDPCSLEESFSSPERGPSMWH